MKGTLKIMKKKLCEEPWEFLNEKKISDLPTINLWEKRPLVFSFRYKEGTRKEEIFLPYNVYWLKFFSSSSFCVFIKKINIHLMIKTVIWDDRLYLSCYDKYIAELYLTGKINMFNVKFYKKLIDDPSMGLNLNC